MSAPHDSVMPARIRAPARGWVVFGDGNHLPWLRFLRRGFRHCFVLLQQGDAWVSVEPLLGGIEVLVHEHSARFNLPGHLARAGFTVVPVGLLSAPGKIRIPMVCTCVEVVQRVIGVRRAFLLTPWQLYRFLISNPPSI